MLVHLWWIQSTERDLKSNTSVYITSHSWQHVPQQRTTTDQQLKGEKNKDPVKRTFPAALRRPTGLKVRPQRSFNTKQSEASWAHIVKQMNPCLHKLNYSICAASWELITSDSLDTNRHLEMEDKRIDAAGGVEGVNVTFRSERRKRSKGMKPSLIIHYSSLYHWSDKVLRSSETLT